MHLLDNDQESLQLDTENDSLLMKRQDRVCHPARGNCPFSLRLVQLLLLKFAIIRPCYHIYHHCKISRFFASERLSTTYQSSTVIDEANTMHEFDSTRSETLKIPLSSVHQTISAAGPTKKHPLLLCKFRRRHCFHLLPPPIADEQGATR
jgi:hypothetical protein